MSRRAVLVANPAAGNGRAATVIEPVRAALSAAGWAVELVVGGSAAESIELARAAVAGGPDAVLALGGDGLLHCVVQAVANTGVPLAVVPAGTGNDLADLLGLPTDPVAAALLADRGATRTLDLGVATHAGGRRWWITVLCTGYDSAVSERAARMRRPAGPRKYDLAILGELARLRPHAIRLTLDGVTRAVPITLIAVGNGPTYGGGLRICPAAIADDGLLDVTEVAPIGRLQLVRLAAGLREGRHVTHPAVTQHRVRSVVLESADGSVQLAYADGERIGPLPVEVGVAAGALRVFTP